MTGREQIYEYVRKKYKTSPEYLWRRYPGYGVLRHDDNRKWFALVMDVPREKLGLPGDDLVDVVNVKVDDPLYADLLVSQPGYLRGYHMNRNNWISILLDGTVPFEEICGMIDSSYLATASAKKKQKIRPPKEWVIPSNPKYYDIIQAFEDEQIIDWKQGKGIKKGDTVYVYVGAPYSAILYKCRVTETDIPYHFQNKNVNITALMKIKLLKKYPPEKFTFEVLNEEYGIFAVRGPRGIPESLSKALN